MGSEMCIRDRVCATTIRDYTDRFPRFHVPEPVPDVIGDPALLEVALSAVVHNAILFSPTNPPRVDITWEHVEGWIALTITDHGMGIDTHGLERIFEMFSRLNKRHAEGLGVGLPMAKRAITLQGGDVTVSSEANVGTRVTMRLRATN